MVGTVGRDAYTDQLRGLVPQGRAWPTHPGTVLASMLDAGAARLAAVDLAAAHLLDELLVSRTLDLLPDWETDLGLPDDCSDLGSTVAIRRAAALDKLVSQPDLNPETFKAMARTFGAEVEIDELNQTRADAIPGLDTTNGKWRFVWWISIPTTADARRMNVLDHVLTPLLSIERNEELECRLQKASPAHTRLFIGYVPDLNYNRLAALMGAYAVRFTASANHRDLFEVTPEEGVELDHTPPGMFTDTDVYWIERVRSTENGVEAQDDNSDAYRKVSVNLHRGTSTVDQDAFLGGLSADWSWVLINETTEEWIMWPAGSPGNVGDGFVTYTVIPSYITDTAGLATSDVDAIAQSFDDGETATAAQSFQNALPGSDLVIALIPNNSFRPIFT